MFWTKMMEINNLTVKEKLPDNVIIKKEPACDEPMLGKQLDLKEELKSGLNDNINFVDVKKEPVNINVKKEAGDDHTITTEYSPEDSSATVNRRPDVSLSYEYELQNQPMQSDNFPVIIENFNSDQRPYKCEYCSYAATQKSNLKTHMRIHSGEKPFKCSICSYATIRKSDLQTHLRIHSGEKPFKCTHCSYAATRRSDLQIHFRIHLGEKPFKCECCPYAASDNSTLKKHIRIHSNEKPFKCDHCSYAATQNSSLQRHLRIHSGEKPFKCECCSYAASDKSYLKKHLKIHSF